MLLMPMKRNCPSVRRSARSNTARHRAGLKNGRTPSMTNISASAPSNSSQACVAAKRYFFAVPAEAPELPRIALKNSLFGSMTITSDLLRKLAR